MCFQIGNKYLIFFFKFDQIDATIGTLSHRITLDKLLSFENWIKIFNELEPFAQNYVSTEKIGTNRSLSIDSRFSLTASWSATNTNLLLVTGLRAKSTYVHYVKIKVSLSVSIDNYIQNLEKENKRLKDCVPDSVTPQQVLSLIPTDDVTKQTSCETSVAVRSPKIKNKTSTIYVDEEYIPTHTKDSPVASVSYVPSKRDQITQPDSNQEYTPTPTKTIRDNDFSSEDSPKSYCPGGGRTYRHEQYNPSESLRGTGSSSYDNDEPHNNYKISISPSRSCSDTEVCDFVGEPLPKRKLNSINGDKVSYSPQYSAEAAAVHDVVLCTPPSTEKCDSKRKHDDPTADNNLEISLLTVSSQSDVMSIVDETPPRDNNRAKKRKDGSSADLFGDSDSDGETKSKSYLKTSTRAHLMRKSKVHSPDKSLEQKITSSTSKRKPSEKSTASRTTTTEHNQTNWLSKLGLKHKKEAEKEKNVKKTKRSQTHDGANGAKKRLCRTKAMTEDELNKFTENHNKRMEDINRQREIIEYPSSPETKIEIK